MREGTFVYGVQNSWMPARVREATWAGGKRQLNDTRKTMQPKGNGMRSRREWLEMVGLNPNGELLNGKHIKPDEVGTLLSDVEPERVEWLWDKRIPLGKITVLDGDPGLGKSILTIDLAAKLTMGRAFPDGQGCEAAGVVIMNAEDGLRDTICPRLEAAGGDARRVLSLTVKMDGQDEVGVTFPEDIDLIEIAIDQVRAKALIIDPMIALLSPTLNAHKDQDVRRGLAPLARMSDKTGVAVILVRHLNKAQGVNALYRGGGSTGIIGADRSGLLVGPHPQDDTLRVLAGQESNLSQPPESLAYCITEAKNGAAKIEYKGVTDAKADASLRVPQDPDERSALGEGMEFLREELKDSPVMQKSIKARAARFEISEATLRRAKTTLKIVSRREGDEGWAWHLPHRPNRRDISAAGGNK